ncbi:glycosyl hydrolase family 28 protein [Halalkalicoccus tibetensis]|uniref:Glycosyl hydrolase family 28 protein n=1 Tax=Halalkalicoccus tibetensis TaxID=175632 RepID=A0ABD5V6W6_9EURY
MLFDDCANVSVRDVTVRDAPAWTLAFRNCESVHVTGVTVQNHLRIPNCDGLSTANHVRVSALCDSRVRRRISGLLSGENTTFIMIKFKQ